MADFNATSFSTTQAQGADPGERAATSFSNTQSQAVFALPACNYISVVAFAPNRTFAGGAQQTYVMEARIVSTTNYVRWISVNVADYQAALAFNATGYLPAQLTDIKVAALYTR